MAALAARLQPRDSFIGRTLHCCTPTHPTGGALWTPPACSCVPLPWWPVHPWLLCVHPLRQPWLCPTVPPLTVAVPCHPSGPGGLRWVPFTPLCPRGGGLVAVLAPGVAPLPVDVAATPTTCVPGALVGEETGSSSGWRAPRGDVLAPSPIERPGGAPLSPRLTPGPQRGPLVTQQISVWQTVQRIQSHPSFFCTTMWQVGQCMASPRCTSVWWQGVDTDTREGHGDTPQVPHPTPGTPLRATPPAACRWCGGRPHRCGPAPGARPGTGGSSSPRGWPGRGERMLRAPPHLPSSPRCGPGARSHLAEEAVEGPAHGAPELVDRILVDAPAGAVAAAAVEAVGAAALGQHQAPLQEAPVFLRRHQLRDRPCSGREPRDRTPGTGWAGVGWVTLTARISRSWRWLPQA